MSHHPLTIATYTSDNNITDVDMLGLISQTKHRREQSSDVSGGQASWQPSQISPGSTICWPNVVSTRGQRRRRWHRVETTFVFKAATRHCDRQSFDKLSSDREKSGGRVRHRWTHGVSIEPERWQQCSQIKQSRRENERDACPWGSYKLADLASQEAEAERLGFNLLIMRL